MTFDEAFEEIASQSEECRRVISTAEAKAAYKYEQSERRRKLKHPEGFPDDDDIVITKASPATWGIR